MRIFLKKIDRSESSSFLVKKVSVPCLEDSLHYHQEYELIYIEKGKGMKLVGDSISEFKGGELALIGANLPHLWRNTSEFYSNDKSEAEVIIIQFNKNFLGKEFFYKPEMKSIFQLLENSKKGIGFFGDSKNKVVKLIKNLPQVKGVEKVIQLLIILNVLSKNQEYTYLSNNSLPINYSIADQEKLNNICQYVMDNYNQDIHLSDVAKVANLGITPFCRYFKSKTNKTFTRFLNEIRINHACNLLIENNLNISEISIECGFNSLTHFNRQFKKIENITPSEYRDKYISILKV